MFEISDEKLSANSARSLVVVSVMHAAPSTQPALAMLFSTSLTPVLVTDMPTTKRRLSSFLCEFPSRSVPPATSRLATSSGLLYGHFVPVESAGHARASPCPQLQSWL